MRAFAAAACACALLACACAGVSGAPAPGLALAPPAPSDDLVCDRPIDDFASTPAGELPAGWETWRAADLAAARQNRAFVVMREDGLPLLRVQPASRELTLGRGVPGWNFRSYPILQWRWRLLQKPAASDRPLARVGAVWLTGFPFMVRRIEYTWSSQQPLSTQDSSRFGQDRSVVVASAASGAGEWHGVQVDVRRHYAELFGNDNPEPPAGIAISAPESERGAQAAVDYRDFRLCRHAREAR